MAGLRQQQIRQEIDLDEADDERLTSFDNILKELRIIRRHMEFITGAEFTDED